MTRDQIIRAWKDEDYRHSLSAAELAQLPQNPAGAFEITEPEMLGQIGGGEEERTYYVIFLSYGCCGGITSKVACIQYTLLCPLPGTFDYTCK